MYTTRNTTRQVFDAKQLPLDICHVGRKNTFKSLKLKRRYIKGKLDAQ